MKNRLPLGVFGGCGGGAFPDRPLLATRAILFALWGVLHLWVGYEGVHQDLTSGAPELWKMLTDGSNPPHAAFQHATDALTANVHAHLILNFYLDVGGYGVLGRFVAWMI